MVLVILDRTAQLAVDPGAAQRLGAMSLDIERILANSRRRDVKDGSFPSDHECYEARPGSLQIAKHAA